MSSSRTRIALAWCLALCAVAACGGRVESVDDSSGSGGGDAGGSTTSTGGNGNIGDARDGGRRTKDASEGDANQCVEVDVTGYDTSCVTDDDCIDVTAGTFCGPSPQICLCGGTAISASEGDRYDAQIQSLGKSEEACPCPYLGRAHCITSTCVFCPSSIGPGDPPPGCPDAG